MTLDAAPAHRQYPLKDINKSSPRIQLTALLTNNNSNDDLRFSPPKGIGLVQVGADDRNKLNGSKTSTQKAILEETRRMVNHRNNQKQMLSRSAVKGEHDSSHLPHQQNQRHSLIAMEQHLAAGSKKHGLFSGSPIGHGKPYQSRDNSQEGMEYKAFTNQHLLRPSADLLNINVSAAARKSSNRPIKSGVHKGKIKLGIDYEGIEKGAPNVTETPNRNRIA